MLWSPVARVGQVLVVVGRSGGVLPPLAVPLLDPDPLPEPLLDPDEPLPPDPDPLLVEPWLPELPLPELVPPDPLLAAAPLPDPLAEPLPEELELDPFPEPVISDPGPELLCDPHDRANASAMKRSAARAPPRAPFQRMVIIASRHPRSAIPREDNPHVTLLERLCKASVSRGDTNHAGNCRGFDPFQRDLRKGDCTRPRARSPSPRFLAKKRCTRGGCCDNI
jgi:hypothetical protein